MKSADHALALVPALLVVCAVACGDDGATSTGSDGGASGSSTTSNGGAGPTTVSTGGMTGSGGSVTTGAGGNGAGSAGCGNALSEPTGQWNARTVDVGGATRELFVYLPTGYDPNRAYPVIYQFHGCSSAVAKENNNVPVETESGADAIIVRGRAVADCWDNGPSGPDVAFFDTLVTTIESAYCADPTRRFVAGYSSGSFMTHRLSCVRGDMIRGVATIAGGMGGTSCTGSVAALLIHDDSDSTVNISASVDARDRYLTENGCDTTTTAFDPSPCVAYDGCDAGLPVVWCQTSGQGHARQDGLAATAFWSFLSGL